MASLTVEVNLDELSLPTTPTMTNTRAENYAEISSIVDSIVETVETTQAWQMVEGILNDQPSPRRNTNEQINETYGTFGTLEEEDNKCCPTCGVHSAWTNADYSHRICVPSIGPAKPVRIQDVFGSETGHNLHFNMEEMSAAERVATGGNIFRCQTVCTGNCALCMNPCQEQGPSQWRQFTGWDWCCNYCWKDLCWRYHAEYLEPNGHVNTLGRFLVFLEE